MRSTSALSKCGDVSDIRSRSKASSLVVLEHAQRAAEIVARRAEAQFDGAAVEAFVEGAGIEVARTFVERVGDQIADAGLVGRVLRRAAAEGIFHRDQRHGGVLHEPGLDAAGRNQMLDLGGGVRRRRRPAAVDRQARGERANAGEAPSVMMLNIAGHERFSSRFGAVSLIR